MTREVKKLIKKYNGSAQLYKPKKTPKSIQEICTTAKLAKGLTVDKIIRDIR